jgi:uncharacterized OB-fold protein
MKKKCILCNREFVPEKSHCALCKECLETMKREYKKTGSIKL